MLFFAILKGIVLGFSIAAVVGPIGVLCLRRSIAEGFWSGLISGFGAAFADATYGAVAAFGLTIISDFLLGKAFLLGIVGGSYLMRIGYKTFRKKPEISTVALEKSSLLKKFVSTFFLIMVNLLTIMQFMVIFTGLNITPENMLLSSALVLGVLFGSMIWWILLATLGSFLKYKLASVAGIKWINRISGTIVGGFGLSIILKALVSQFN